MKNVILIIIKDSVERENNKNAFIWKKLFIKKPLNLRYIRPVLFMTISHTNHAKKENFRQTERGGDLVYANDLLR